MLERIIIKSAAKRRIASAGLIIILITLFFIVAANAAVLVVNSFFALTPELVRELSADPDAAASFVQKKFESVKHPLAVLCVFTVYSFMTEVIDVGYSFTCLSCSRSEKLSFSDLFGAFPLFGKALVTRLLINLLVYLGLFFFFIPGLILSLAFSMSDFVLRDRPELSVFGVLRESARLMRGRKLSLFFFELSFIGWVLMDRLIFISRIWTTPYMTVSKALFYDKICLGDGENTVI